MADETAIMGFPYPEDTDNNDVPQYVQGLADDLDLMLRVGNRADRPGSGTRAGQRYVCLDTLTEYLWDGDSWDAMGTPPGTVAPMLRDTAPKGWLAMTGAVVNAQTLYPDLWAYVDTALRSGSTLNLPDTRGRTAAGIDESAGVLAALTEHGVVTGAATVTLATGEIPAHTHTASQASHNHGGSTGSNDVGSATDTGYLGTSAKVGLADGSGGVLVGVATGAGAQGLGATSGGEARIKSSSTGHTHPLTGTNHSHSVSSATPAITVDNAGGGGAHANVQPTFGAKWMIKL